MRSLCVVACVACMLGLPAIALADVHVLTINSHVRRGHYEAVAIFSTAPCEIHVHYRSHGWLTDPALGSKGNLLGTIHWTWRVSPRAHLGRWTVDFVCGQAGTLRTYFTVVP